MKLSFSSKFRKQYKKLRPAQRKRFGEALTLFQEQPYHPRLYNHALKGEWKDHRSIAFGGDWRAHYINIDENEAFFVAIGTHNQFYDQNMINLRHATIKDLPILRHWEKQPHVIAADPNDDWEWETELLRNPDWRKQLIAELDKRPIGFVQIIDPAMEESHYWGDNVPHNFRAIDIWIGEAKDLGKGYGTDMMKLALEGCFSDPNITAVLIDPLEENIRAHRFYERLGFHFLERRTFGEDRCCVYRLNRSAWEDSDLYQLPPRTFYRFSQLLWQQ